MRYLLAMKSTPARALRAFPVRTAAGTARAALALVMLCALGLGAGCTGRNATGDAPAAWERHLRGDAVVALGEVHDNPLQHRRRLAVLRRAIAAGWRPAIAMEQFDTDRQADLDRARAADTGADPVARADRLIAAAAPAKGGWDWALYRDVVALALQYDLPLLAANLPRADASKLVHADARTVFGAQRSAELRLDRPTPESVQSAQEQEIANGHCGALPASILPGMARAQFARDAVMAEVLRTHAARGVVLLAGNGHVRRDLGVPRWLDGALAARVFAVGFVESDGDSAVDAPVGAPGPAGAFDAVVVAPAAERGDPCEGFKPPPGPAHTTASR